MRRPALLAAVAAVAPWALAACLQIPETQAPQCQSTSDCDEANGEVCAEGVCYGDPPTGTFALALSPPAGALSVVATERASEPLPADGFLADLAFDAPISISGTVAAASCPTSDATCPTAPGATVTVTRASRFAGGDGVTASTHTDGEGSYMLAVPPSMGSDDAFVVTVTPDDLSVDGGSAYAPLELVPPARTTLRATGDTTLPIALGGPDTVVVTGEIDDADQTLLGAYRVSAVGRWHGDTTDSEVSSVAYTTDGHFAIALASGLVGDVTLVARPIGGMGAGATLELGDVDSTKSTTRQVVAPSGLGTSRVLNLIVQGTSPGGEIVAIGGARVSAIATATPLAGQNDAARAVVSAEVITGDDGLAQLPVLDGSGFGSGYHLRVVPPAGSSLGVLDEDSFALEDGPITLRPRVTLAGRVVDANGDPVADISVTARPSIHFVWELPVDSQAILAQIPAATATTPDQGDFALFVDPFVEGIDATYDLTFQPPSGSSLPSFVVQGVPIPAGTVGPATVSTGDLTVPDGAALHGRITDPAGSSVVGAQLRMFLKSTDATPCALPYAPVPCSTAPATLEAQATSDAQGLVRFTLPRAAQ